LDTFGIKSLDELPPLKLIDDEEIDENDLFKSKYVENE
ncbi:MAG: SMC-Scp complex subunit ScpB, partial [Mollicutes bacterium]|nr:SMC-Scp complex subunit ScpB [Mollicutes bacterium]